MGAGAAFSSNWSHDIWSSGPSSMTVRNNSGPNRSQARPAPLPRPVPSTSTSMISERGSIEDSETITGSGSLLATSEFEPSDRNRWMPVGTISAPLTGAQRTESSISPGAQRSAQLPRSSSPYFFSQRGAFGQGTTPIPSHSQLDPTTRSFDISTVSNFLDPQSANVESGSKFYEVSRSDFAKTGLGDVSLKLDQTYSNQSSRAASRAGSQPQSRNGNNELSRQFEGFMSGQISSTASNVFGHRPNQPSRNSTFSNNSSRAGDQWQDNINELGLAMGRVNLTRGAPAEPGLHSLGDHVQQRGGLDAAGNVSLTGFLNARRTPSATFEAEVPFAPNSHGSHTSRPQAHPSSSAPSTSRNNSGGPHAFSPDTPYFPESARPQFGTGALPPSPPHTAADNQAYADYQVQQLRYQQNQGYLANRNLLQQRLPFQSPAFDLSPDLQRASTNLQYYTQVQNGGYGAPIAPLQLMPPGFFPRAPPRGPAKDEQQERLRSPLLEAFRDKHNPKRYELKVSFPLTGAAIPVLTCSGHIQSCRRVQRGPTCLAFHSGKAGDSEQRRKGAALLRDFAQCSPAHDRYLRQLRRPEIFRTREPDTEEAAC